MTPKQIERIKKKIADIKRMLAAEKKMFGGYDDSRGLRYAPPGYFIQLDDYAGGLRYIRWFDKSFPDDICFPEFFFEETIILFKSNKIKDAEQKAFRTFCSNPYWIDKFFGLEIRLHDIWHSRSTMGAEYLKTHSYSSEEPKLVDFGDWLYKLIGTKEFVNRSNKYLDIYKQLKDVKDMAIRRRLLGEAAKLEERAYYSI